MAQANPTWLDVLFVAVVLQSRIAKSPIARSSGLREIDELLDRRKGRDMNRLHYDNWPRSVRIAYCCTFPVSCPVLMLSMMLGTIGLGLVLMAACVVVLPFSMMPHVRGIPIMIGMPLPPKWEDDEQESAGWPWALFGFAIVAAILLVWVLS